MSSLTDFQLSIKGIIKKGERVFGTDWLPGLVNKIIHNNYYYDK